SQPACRACPVGDGCGLVRCPWCSYENPAWPGWMRAVGRWLGRLEGRKAPAEIPSAPTLGQPGRPVVEPEGRSLPVLRGPVDGPGSRREEEDAA
ncbi:MAG TPA: hypothetical protein VE173_04400, partial [Longimicrobiales bacterium]|nr:hypothetical protein [Longimicrobiales bacterium]